MAQIVVVGSVNMDLVVHVPRLPVPGETVLGGTFATFPGGKGANQAVAAARLGAAVVIVGRLGRDAFGQQLRDGLLRDRIDVSHLRVDPEAASGVALITVDSAGRNAIAVASGANMHVTTADVDAARDAIVGSQILLLQLELPLMVVHHAARVAQAAGCRVILDPAPAPPEPLPDDLLRLVSVINPNEVEARTLTGISVDHESDARRAAEALLARGCPAAVIKLGGRGAYLATGSVREAVPALAVDVIDTTAAGDAFAAGLSVALSEGANLSAATRFANAVGAFKVTRMGAQPSMPTRQELQEFARQKGFALLQ